MKILFCSTCGRSPVVARGLCNNHYQQEWRKGGLTPLPRRPLGQYNKRSPLANADGTVSIPLTRGYTAIIDADDLPRVRDYTWHATNHENAIYAGTRLRDEAQTFVYLHRLIASVPKGAEADHINRNTLDNRKVNLRKCDGSLNGMNRGKRSNGGTSKYKGVHFDRARNKWRTEFHFRGVKVSRRFNTEKEAALFYNQMLTEHLGEEATCFNDVQG